MTNKQLKQKIEDMVRGIMPTNVDYVFYSKEFEDEIMDLIKEVALSIIPEEIDIGTKNVTFKNGHLTGQWALKRRMKDNLDKLFKE